MTTHNKNITPVGTIRKKDNTSGDDEVYDKTQETKMLEDSNRLDILDEDVFAQVKKTAMENPQLESVIDQAKAFTHENKDKIKHQCTNIVAFYNVAKEKPFFFVSPAEARIAIDYIKQTRQGYQQDIESEAARDSYIQEFIDRIESLNLQKDPKKLKGIQTKAFNKDVDRYRRTFDRVDIEDIEDIFNTRIKGGSYLDLGLLNQMFSHVESKDLLVNVMLMNVHKIADIRLMGNTVYDNYSYKVQLKRKCFGRLWTSEIYPCNKLDDNQIIIGSFDATRNIGFFYNIIITK